MAKYMIMTRDWKGGYDKIPKGWKLFGNEDDIKTGSDGYAMIFYKGNPKQKKTPQEIYDICEALNDDDVVGYTKEFMDDEVMWET